MVIRQEATSRCFAPEMVKDQGLELEDVLDGQPGGAEEFAALLADPVVARVPGDLSRWVWRQEQVQVNLVNTVPVVVGDDVFDGDGGEEGGGQDDHLVRAITALKFHHHVLQGGVMDDLQAGLPDKRRIKDVITPPSPTRP